MKKATQGCFTIKLLRKYTLGILVFKPLYWLYSCFKLARRSAKLKRTERNNLNNTEKFHNMAKTTEKCLLIKNI